jgi:serine/threonine protein kinase
LEILSFVHQQNVIHRDLKPHNLMRRRSDGKLVLIDFGAVKEVSAMQVNSQGNTSLTVGIGTPGYMPDEQANGKPKLCSDVYAVGMLGIQALTGLSPSQLGSDPNTGEIIWRPLVNVQVSDGLADVLSTMVKAFFPQRYPSAVDALQALHSVVGSPKQPFSMGKFAVTQAQWQAVMGSSNPSRFKGDKRPVEQISWHQAREFCQKLAQAQQMGRSYRLPSEAEWEYACRAGTTTPFSFGETITPALVNYNGNFPYGAAPKGQFRASTTDVGSFPPNAFGLYDHARQRVGVVSG